MEINQLHRKLSTKNLSAWAAYIYQTKLKQKQKERDSLLDKSLTKHVTTTSY